MESSSALRPLDESLLRELPQLSLRIAPLREPVSSRTLSVPSPLEPNASGARDSNNISNSNSNSGKIQANAKEGLPTVTEFLNAARIRKTELSADSQSNVERPPRPILPAFVNLRALEKFPFSSSFDDDALQGPRKRRRRDPQPDSFSEHLQLPIPQAQKEQRPPPFGPFAILNGLNEPPPNAALLPPIEAGSNISQLLNKPSRGDAAADSGTSVSAHAAISDGQPAERRDTRLEDILRTSLNADGDHDQNDNVENVQSTNPVDPDEIALAVREAEKLKDSKESPLPPAADAPMSPKTRGRSRKNLRKWSEEETTNLLRGVIKCGIGNWTAILAQPELKFNQRTASNLKDSASDPDLAAKQLHDTLANSLLKAKAEGSDESPSKLHLSHLIPSNFEPNFGAGSPACNPQEPLISSTASDTDPRGSTTAQSQSPSSGNSTPALSSKSRTTLASLGIPEPHVSRTKRRSRRPFTAAEDEALLKGYAVHGFQWTLIQQDSRLNLSHRKATDLRDRFRTKFPHAYRDGGSVSGKALTSQNQAQESAVGTSTPRPHAGTEQSPSKAYAMTPTQTPATTPRTSVSRGRHAATPSQSNPAQIDPALLPPPPQGFLEHSMYLPPAAAAGALSFSLDDGPGTGASSAVETPWEDNTLAPMIWDELT
ncbi:hypothetical protein N7489_002375 [Penicillium chrysogenum]|uniref:HTH myb-type domain-containing protein n=1 Tax=Penicillium chrysogenum TaxID=5076 RepID=A0ABQ8WMJ5_PENCH|nr:uncharacterized protein N7489_002375 [Penicillium chrysogenum]KAJ5248297.1 hypothetical protein N7524_012257 [Penicillium chrysogenum]KAJ5251965.1 hypothetical protein N7489_002375 [Penicillium chrysogenum]KAJ5270870.1 hypothetical protein N7505_006628 [Penicillium chrysogenum]KAJ6146376.1 hypothetical protein N7497_008358 [Penicillium chrysogenum]